PIITAQPQSQIVAAGTDVTLSVGVTPSTTPLSYQWRKEGFDLAGATRSTLVLSNTTARSGGAYSVVVTNSLGTATSDEATLAIVQDTSVSGSLGANVTLRIILGGALPTSVQWRFNGANIPGATRANYVITNAQPANAGQYSIVVSTAFGSFTNFSKPLIVDPTFTKITT